MYDDEEFHNKMKQELIPVISNHLGLSTHLLKDFPVEILNNILNCINILPDDELKKIIVVNAPHPQKVPDLLDEALKQNVVQEACSGTGYDPCLDLRAGILAIVPSDARDEVEEKINQINEVEKLTELGQKPINELLKELAIRSEEIEPEPEEYDEKRDIIAGIMAMVPDENLKDEIEEKLNEIEDINEIVKLATMEYNDFLRELEIEDQTFIPGQSMEGEIPGMDVTSMYAGMPIRGRPTDMKDDIKAGILARLPPSVRTFIQDKIMAINDMDQLVKLSSMNYLQIQSELGVPISSPALAPPSVVNPVDTAERTQSQTIPQSASPQAPSEVQSGEKELDDETKERLRQRNEEVEKYVGIITKIVDKVAKKDDLPENYEDKVKILKRIYPDRLSRLVHIFKSQKKKKRIILMFEWFVISQRIEEIETYVEHWQGATERGGGFRAAIGVSRYDSIIEHLKTNELNQIITNARMALQKIRDPNIQVRAVGVEEIKSIANILLHKA